MQVASVLLHIRIYTNTYLRISINTDAYKYYQCILIYEHMYMQTARCERAAAYTCANTHMYTYIYTQYIYIDIYIHTHIRVYVDYMPRACWCAAGKRRWRCMCLHICSKAWTRQVCARFSNSELTLTFAPSARCVVFLSDSEGEGFCVSNQSFLS